MDSQWDLSVLYQSFEDPAYEADVARLERCCRELRDFADTLAEIEPSQGLRRGIELLETRAVLTDKLCAYPNLRRAANTKDNDAVTQSDRLKAITSSSAGAVAAFEMWAGKLPDLMALVEADPILRDYQFWFAQRAELASHLLSQEGEEILAKMSMSGSAAWGALRGLVTSTATAPCGGEMRNLTTLQNMARDPDPQVRKEAYEAELALCESIKDPVAAAMNAIKLETITESSLRGYGSPHEMALNTHRMSHKTLQAMLGAIDAYLPRFWKYYRAKARLLGRGEALYWYDLGAEVGESRTYTPQQIRQLLKRHVGSFAPELKALIGRAYDEKWIDFYPRSGKRGGAFCSSLRSMGRSFILANGSNRFPSAVTLAHELGHAFHNLCIQGHRPLNMSYSRPLSETASTFQECLLYNGALQEAETPAEKLSLLDAQLRGSAGLVVDIYSRYLFEDAVFRNRESRFMDARALCAIMEDAQKKCFGDGLDHRVLHPYMWLTKPHYYSSAYYNYPYAFGCLLARGLYARYKQEGAAFVPKYKAFLYACTVANTEDAAKVADMDLTNESFWIAALEQIAEEIDQYCKLVEEQQCESKI